jgi:hypothetical protein
VHYNVIERCPCLLQSSAHTRRRSPLSSARLDVEDVVNPSSRCHAWRRNEQIRDAVSEWHRLTVMWPPVTWASMQDVVGYVVIQLASDSVQPTNFAVGRLPAVCLTYCLPTVWLFVHIMRMCALCTCRRIGVLTRGRIDLTSHNLSRASPIVFFPKLNLQQSVTRARLSLRLVVPE